MYHHPGQVMVAVIALSEAGFMHGDVKDSNVMVSPRTRHGGAAINYDSQDFDHFAVKLVDFGTAQLCDEVQHPPVLASFSSTFVSCFAVRKRNTVGKTKKICSSCWECSVGVGLGKPGVYRGIYWCLCPFALQFFAANSLFCFALPTKPCRPEASRN